jgi:peptide/nickel transport system permease protein
MTTGTSHAVPMRFRLRTRIGRDQTARRAGLIVGLTTIGVIAIGCVVVPMLWSYPPNQIVARALQAPSWKHPFGTDTIGRDVFLRTMAGGRIDLLVASGTVALSAVIGTLVGITAAFSGRWVDATLMRIVDAVIAFPFMVLVWAIVLLFGASKSLGPLPAGLPSLLFAIIITDWVVYARLGRAQTLTLRNREFVIAAELLGYPRRRIVLRHLLPNVRGTIGAYAVADAILQVVVIASLPFLGAGIQPPTAEWGAIMFGGSTVIATAWWVTILPGVVLAITGIGLSLVADSLLVRTERPAR